MILSCSRRTDIPAYYSDWLINRLQEGFVLTRNPMNHAQISKIVLSPDIVDCIVFWTKDPQNMMNKLDIMDALGYKYYFQFTLTPYDQSIEKGLRDKEEIIKTFSMLNNKIGKEKVIWRYDPIIINRQFDIAYHKEQFAWLCSRLNDYTDQCIISFVDLYSKLKTNLIREINESEMQELSKWISAIAQDFDLEVKACCEKLDLSQYNIGKSNCIDQKRIEKICGYNLKIGKDKNQRSSCGCLESIDIGVYNTCKNGCIYCYANYSQKSVEKNCKSHNPKGPLLIGNVNENENIKIRNVRSNKSDQLNFL